MSKKWIAGAALPVLVCLALAGCGGNATPTTAPSATATSGAAANATTPATGGVQVKIVAKDNMFEPMSYTVEGTSFQIVAVNEGQAIHEVEVKDLLPETKLAPGQSKTVDLTDVKPGTYKIYCEIHQDQGMEGELIVK